MAPEDLSKKTLVDLVEAAQELIRHIAAMGRCRREDERPWQYAETGWPNEPMGDRASCSEP